MKKILAIALAAVFVLGMAATAMAVELSDTTNMSIKGEYRVRGISQDNRDANDETPDKNAYINQRLRLYLNFAVGDDVAVKTRFSIADGQWNGTNDTRYKSGCEDVTYETVGGDFVTIEHCNAMQNFTVDHAYMTIKKFNGTLTLGVQPANWGNKFWSWGGIKERIKFTTSVANGMVTLGAFTQKDYESNADATEADVNAYSVLAVAKPVEGHTVGLIYVVVNDNNKDVDTKSASTVPAYNDTTVLDIYYSGKVGPVNLSAEMVDMDSDFVNSGKGGMFLAGNLDVTEMINVGLAYASAEDGFATSGFFTPTLMVGTTQATGVLNLGSGNGYGDSASAIVLSGKFKITDDMSAGVNYAMATLDDDGGAPAGTAIKAEKDLDEIDVYANYKLATNTNLFVGYAQGSPDGKGWGTKADGVTAKDETITSMAFQIQTKF